MTNIQSAIDELVKNYDNRISVFEIEIQGLTDETLKLSGRLLDESQLEDLRHVLPDLKLDPASVRILSREPHEQMHVATNLIGLYEKPTFGMPLSSELTYGTELEVLGVEKRWAFTRQPDGYLGWVYRPYLANGAAPRLTHLILAPTTELHAEPSATGEVISRVVSGSGVVVEETHDGWSCISANRSGWIPSDHLRAFIDLPASVEGKRAAL
ncbi:MAG TPA: hypothetical protein VJ785_11815, partial [Anaerolineales bacterium]|nr:hypothetical protein [Anaerolineales bacterium]